MTLSAGARLGPYEIQSALGAGGMGEVYRARDTKLGRDVALKVLPDLFAADPDRLARFEREAHLLASLNHPNIAGIHGVEDADGVRALVLELVEGPTLAGRIAQGPIPLDDALPIAKQIAEALEAAHEQGIVHRDLKPANIKLRPDGTVKVLDFGLAKLSETGVGAGFSRPDLSQSPTITSPALMTGIGIILGTAAYMAPEQAKGREADKRSDIWAFGVVLYEMLTGKRAFEGDDVSETLADVIKGQLSLDVLPADTPPAIRRLLRRCLTKDRKGRLSDAAAARLEIEEAIAAPAGDATRGAPALLPTRSIWKRAIPITSGTLVGAVLAGVAAWSALSSGPGAPAEVTRFAIDLPPNVQLSTNAQQRLAISRDGRRIIYAGNRAGNVQLYSQPLDRLESSLLPGIESGLGSIFPSPDGEWIGYNDTRDGRFKKVRLAGGPPATICDAPAGTGGFRGASWGPAGTIVFATSGYPGLMHVPAAGGVAQPLTKPGEGEMHQRPAFLPDGRALLFVISKSGTDSVAVLRLDTGQPRVLLAGAGPRFAASGHLVFLRDGALWAVPFDSERLEVQGDAVPVLEGVDSEPSAARYDIADNGTLVYAPISGTLERTLVWVDRQGREEPLEAPPRAYVIPRLSPDGKRIAVDVRDQANDIWMWEPARETLTRLTFGRSLDGVPVWSADGTRILFRSDRGGTFNLFSQVADGTGQLEQLTDRANGPRPTSVSPDGTAVIFDEVGPQVGDVMQLALRGDRGTQPSEPTPVPQMGTVRPLVQTSFNERMGVISPDGRWLAYESNASGSVQVFVRPFPDVSSGQWQVSTTGGRAPVWAHSGKELFYVSGSALMRVSVERGPTWASGTPERVLGGPYFFGGVSSAPAYDISLDDKRFLMIKEPAGAVSGPGMVVVENWFEELKRLLPAK